MKRRKARGPEPLPAMPPRLSEALAAQKEFETAGGRPSDPSGPLSRYAASTKLPVLKKRFDTGDRLALLAAIRECARCDVLMPEWVARGFIAAYDKVLTCRVKSWDAAFGAPFPPKAHLAARRRRRELQPQVYIAVVDASNRGQSINDELFSAVGKKLNISMSLARELYYGRGPKVRLPVPRNRRQKM